MKKEEKEVNFYENALQLSSADYSANSRVKAPTFELDSYFLVLTNHFKISRSVML